MSYLDASVIYAILSIWSSTEPEQAINAYILKLILKSLYIIEKECKKLSMTLTKYN